MKGRLAAFLLAVMLAVNSSAYAGFERWDYKDIPSGMENVAQHCLPIAFKVAAVLFPFKNVSTTDDLAKLDGWGSIDYAGVGLSLFKAYAEVGWSGTEFINTFGRCLGFVYVPEPDPLPVPGDGGEPGAEPAPDAVDAKAVEDCP